MLGGLGILALLTAVVISAAWFVNEAVAAPCLTSATSSVSEPGSGASPQDVARTFVAALNSGDTTTVTAMLAPEEKPRLTNSGLLQPSYYGNICEIQNLQIGSVETRRPGDVSPRGYKQNVVVDATYNLVLKDASDESAAWYGTSGKAFVLVRNADNEPWLIGFMGPIV